MKWVLVIESSEVDRKYVGKIVDRLGYKVYSAQTGEEALHLMNQSLPHALILGERIADWDPLELGRRIRQDRILSAPPMLLMTSNRETGYIDSARQAGFAAIVSRPMSIRKFFASLEMCLSSSRRLHIRAPMQFPVLLRRGLEKLTMTTHNFGEGGMYIRTADPLPVKEHVDLDFRLPGLRNDFSFRSEVVHSRLAGNEELPSGMGLKFLNVKPAIETVLSIFMENFLVRSVAA